MYQKCQELGLPILSDSGPWPHSHLVFMYPNPLGYKPYEDEMSYAEPKNWAKVLEAFPKLTIILAHIGSAWWDERIELAQKYPNVYFDTSQGFSAPDQLPVVARCNHSWNKYCGSLLLMKRSECCYQRMPGVFSVFKVV